MAAPVDCRRGGAGGGGGARPRLLRPILTFSDLTVSLEAAHGGDELRRMFDLFRAMPDDGTRLRYLVDNPVFSAFRVEPRRRRKDAAESERMRREANAAFAARDFENALACFSRSVVMADTPPPPDSDELPEDPFSPKQESTPLALAYFNRANNLYQMKRYWCALKDLRRALGSGYARPQAYKVHALESKCWEKLRYFHRALDAFQVAYKLQVQSGHSEESKEAAVLKRCAELEAKSLMGSSSNKIDDEAAIEVLDSPSRVHYKTFRTATEPEVRGARNPKFPAASDALDLSFSGDRGRFFVAAREIRAGEVLIVEPPYAKVLVPQHWDTHCFHCFHYTDAPVPCDECATIIFCSESCKEKARRYHEYECEFLSNLAEESVANLTILAVRIIMTAGMDELRKADALLDQISCDQPLSIPLERCDPLEYVNICTQVTHRDDWSGMMLFQVGLLAAYVMFLLEKSGYFDSCGANGNVSDRRREAEARRRKRDEEQAMMEKREAMIAQMMMQASGMAPPKNAVLEKGFGAGAPATPNLKQSFDSMPATKQDDMLLVGRFLMRHLMALRSNRFSVSESVLRHLPAEPEAHEGSGDARREAAGDAARSAGAGAGTRERVARYVSLGRAVCCTMNMCNHSCCSNAVWDYLADDRFVLRAVRPIRPGQEVTISYGYNFQVDQLEDRQQNLKKDFMFDCSCDACIENWPTAKESVTMRPSFLCRLCRTTLGPASSTCPACGHDCHDAFVRLAATSPGFQAARRRLDDLDDVAAAESAVLEHVAAVDAVLHPSNIEYVMAVDCLKQAYILGGLVTTRRN